MEILHDFITPHWHHELFGRLSGKFQHYLSLNENQGSHAHLSQCGFWAEN
jgi:hypothetical protein